MQFSEFLKRIDTKNIDPIYFLTGEESFLQLQVQQLLRRVVVIQGAEDFDWEVLEGGEFRYEVFLNALRALPLISHKRLLILRHLEELDNNKHKIILNAITGDLSKLLLVLSYEEKCDFKHKSPLNEMRERFAWVDLSPPKGAEFEKILKWMLKGRKIEPNLLSFLAESRVDLWQISNWCEQALTLINDDIPLNLETLKNFVDLGGTADIWRLCDAVGKKELKQAQILLVDLLRNREKAGNIVWSLKELFIYLNLFCQIRAKGGKLEPYQERIALHPFRFRNYSSMSVNFSVMETEHALWKLQDIDEKLKSSQIEPETLLVELIDDISGKKEKQPRTENY
jgi:DNA polymerase III delta subunit